MVLSPDGALLSVADVGSDGTRVLDPATLVTPGAFGADRLSGPHDVAFDRQGRLPVADPGNDRLQVLNADPGSIGVVRRAGAGGSGGGFLWPSAAGWPN